MIDGVVIAEDHVERLVAAACRLLASDHRVRSVRIVAAGRPSYPTLYRCQERAQAWQARLTVDGRGAVTIRSGAAAEGEASPHALG